MSNTSPPPCPNKGVLTKALKDLLIKAAVVYSSPHKKIQLPVLSKPSFLFRNPNFLSSPSPLPSPTFYSGI